MNKLLKLALLGAVALTLSTTTASADAAKGQKLFVKKLKKPCGITGAKMAAKHSQDEWESKKDNLADEIKAMCPDVKDKALKDKYIEHYYDFFYDFANDSGNVPSC
ncbi:MAG: cytochrome C [Campylobacterota bacterium]|nr:cytochrome C [Campylobacterota bacterium]